MIIYRAYEVSKLFYIRRRWLNLSNRLDFLRPRFKSAWHQQMPKPVCFLDRPFALHRINCEAVKLLRLELTVSTQHSLSLVLLRS